MSSIHAELDNSQKFQRTAGQRQTTFRVSQPRKKGLMDYEHLCYYDAETDTRDIEALFPKITSEMKIGEIEALFDEYIANNPLNIQNLVQICILVPSDIKGLSTALRLVRKHEEIEINNKFFTRCFLGGLSDPKSSRNEIHEKAIDTAYRFLAFRKALGKSAIFAGFNNLKFDSGILGKLTDNPEITRSLTHVLTTHSFREIDLMKWAVACGWRSLADVGRGLKKLHYKNSLKLDGMTSTNQTLLDKYNARDVEILANLVHMLNDFGIYHHNMPSFVKQFYGKTIEEKGIIAIDSDAAYGTYEGIGGRSEAYEYKLDNAAVYDMNSLYPSAQYLFPFPKIYLNADKKRGRIKLNRLSINSLPAKELKNKINKLYKLTGNAIISDKKFIDSYRKIFDNVFYWLRVKISGIKDKRLKHIFPFAYKDDKGSVRFTLNTEAVYEVDSYNISFLAHCDYEIIDIRVTQTEDLIFKDTVYELYEKRKEYKKTGNPLEMLCKIILNSGFGIWGSRGDKPMRDYSTATREKIEALKETVSSAGIKPVAFQGYDKTLQDTAEYRVSGDKVYKRAAENQRFVRTSIPAISQTTLSHSRALMYSIIRKIILDGGIVYYTDTDSITIDARGEEILKSLNLIGGELGEIKLEDRIEKGYAIASKVYNYTTHDGKHIARAKGVKNMLKVNTTVSTSHTDPLRIAQRTIAVAGGSTKRRLCPITLRHENEYGTKDSAWGKMLIEMLEFTAMERGETIDKAVIEDFVLEL